MKIRVQITLIQLATLLTVLVSIFVLYNTLTNIRDVKNIQVYFNQFVDLEEDVKDLIYNSLYIDEQIVDYSKKIIEKQDQIVRIADFLYDKIPDHHKNIEQNFMTLYYKWQQKNSEYYALATTTFKEFSAFQSDWIPIIANHGLLKAADILEDEKGSEFYDEEKVETLSSLLKLINKYKTDNYDIMKLKDQVLEDISYTVEKDLATSYLILIITILITVTTSILISMRVAESLIVKVHKVEESLEKISEGDLTSKVEEHGGDEFEILANSFNTLTDMLLNKSESMREIMNEISDIISEEINMDSLMVKITELAKSSSRADASSILLVDKFKDQLIVEHTEGFFPPPYSLSTSVKSKRNLITEKFKSTPIPFHSNYLATADILKGKPLFIKDTEADKTIMPMNSNPQDIQFIKSSMTIPLVVSNKLLGVISLAKTKRDETFSDLDFSNMVSFVEYVSLTIDNIYKYMELLEKSEMKREMGIASEIQTQLIPKKIPVLPNVDITAFSDSAKGISGDYYDIYKITKDKSVATVCDVAGKGVAAALVLVIIRTILQLASHSKSTSKDLLNFLNKSISDRVKTDNIATLSCIVYDNSTNKISLTIAGDTPVLIYRSKAQLVERISHSDIPVGIDTTNSYTNKELELSEDDVLYMFSDGLLEVRNDFNDIFSIEELESFILENSNNRTETISVLLREYLQEFRGSQERLDDETVIIFKKI